MLIARRLSCRRRSTVSARRRPTFRKVTLRIAIQSIPCPQPSNQLSAHQLRLMSGPWILLSSGRTAAVTAFQMGQNPFAEAVTRRHGGETESARWVTSWGKAARQVSRDLVENRALIMRVFLPFVVGYYLSYLFRTINALIAAPLASELRARRRRAWPAHFGLLPDLRRRPDTDRHPAGPLWAAADSERIAGSRSVRRGAVRIVRQFPGAHRWPGVDRSGCRS